MRDNSELLNHFAQTADNSAFKELVGRHTNLVYSAALRQVGGDSHLAADVTQEVFLALARNALALSRHQHLSAWLYTTTRFLSAKAVRANFRRQRREQTEYTMAEITRAAADEPNWQEIRPVIDLAMHELSNADRNMILERFFEGRTISELAIVTGLSEAAVRKRGERALTRLHGRLVRMGFTSTATALGAVLTANTVISAPSGLAASAASYSIARSASTGTAGYGAGVHLKALYFMQKSKLAAGTFAALLALGIGVSFGKRYEAKRIADRIQTVNQSEIAALRATNQRLIAQISKLRAGSSAELAVKAGGAAMGQGAGSDELQLLQRLQQDKVLTAKVKPAEGKNRKLTDGFAKLFALSPSERDSLQQTLDKAESQLESLEKANSTVTRNPDGSLKLQVTPFPKEGGTIYDDLMNSFAQILGPERQAAFVALGSAGQLEDDLAGFGAQQRTLNVTLAPAANGESYDYKIDDLQQRGGQTFHYFYVFANQEAAGNYLGTAADLIPRDFGKTK